MVRELHALYSNLVPISTERDSPAAAHGAAPPRSTYVLQRRIASAWTVSEADAIAHLW